MTMQTPAATSGRGPSAFGPATPSAPKVAIGTATALAIADMIGIGVFTSLGFQVKDLPSGFALMALWLLGGLVALCGALSYAELATAFPRSGGEYNFLARTYHRAVGFLAGWISATVGFAAPVALAAMAFAEYATGVVPGLPKVPLAIGLVWLVTAVQLAGLRQSITFQNVATAVKVALIVAFIAFGFTMVEPQPVSFVPSARDVDYLFSAPFAISLVYVMYSYSGWNAATYIAGEIDDPARTLPVSLLIAVVVVTALYMGLNAVFLYTTPMAALAGNIDVGLIAGRHMFGEAGGRVVAALICIGLVSAVSAMMWIGPRVTMAMGEDIRLLSFFSARTAGGVPARALLLQVAVATVMLLTRSFQSVLEFVQFSLMLCSFMAVLGVIVLRFTRPDLPRPYRVWAYPLTPLVFLAMTLFILVHMLREKPWESLAGFAMMLAGLLLYAASAAVSRPNDIPETAKP